MLAFKRILPGCDGSVQGARSVDGDFTPAIVGHSRSGAAAVRFLAVAEATTLPFMNRGFLVATLFGLAFYGRVLGGCLSDDDVTPGPGVDGSVSLDASARPDALVPSEGGVDATTDGGAVPDASSDAPADALDASVDACVPGLVAWWPAEGTAEDTKGANEGTLIGDAGDAGFTTGKVGVAFSFDGTDRYVQVNAQSSLDMSAGDFTVDVWFKLASLATDQTIFQKLSGSTTADPSHFIEFTLRRPRDGGTDDLSVPDARRRHLVPLCGGSLSEQQHDLPRWRGHRLARRGRRRQHGDRRRCAHRARRTRLGHRASRQRRRRRAGDLQRALCRGDPGGLCGRRSSLQVAAAARAQSQTLWSVEPKVTTYSSPAHARGGRQRSPSAPFAPINRELATRASASRRTRTSCQAVAPRPPGQRV